MVKRMYHLNDKTMKYKSMTQCQRQHEYLGLPGKFKIRYPQEVVFPNMESGRMDELYMTDEGVLINLEEESDDIRPRTVQKFDKYNRFIRFMYSNNVLHAVISHKKPKGEIGSYQMGPSNTIKIYYIYISQEKLWKKYDNIIKKVEQKEELTDMEALDMAFLPKFIDSEHKEFIIDSLTKIFEEVKINDKKLKMDVAIIIDAMIIKHIHSESKQNELKERISMRKYENEMEKIIYDEYGDELYEKDRQIEEKDKELKTKNRELITKDKELITKDKELITKDKELKNKDRQIEELHQSNSEYKNKIKQLSKMDDLNVPEAKEILQALMLL